MNSKIYVGNLNFNTSNDDLTQAFSKYGTVRSAKIVMDRDTNRSKGFAFVEMGTSLEAETAIMRLNGSELEGRSLNVSIAKPKTDDRPRY
jgi:RNA recognition motif-containing protein